MEDTSTLIRSQRPTETLDSSDHHDEHDHHHHNNNNNNIDETTSTMKEPSDSRNSLTVCRQTGSLVDDELPELDDPADENRNVNIWNDDAPTSQQQDAAVHHHEAMTMTSITEDSTIPLAPNTDEMPASSELSTLPPPRPIHPWTTTAPIAPPSNTQRLWMLSQPITSRIPLPSPPHNWDSILSSGNKIKTLVAEAMGQVQHTILAMPQQSNHPLSMKRARDSGGPTDDTTNDDDDDAERPFLSKQPRVVNVADFTVELAREKTAQVMQLQRVRTNIKRILFETRTSYRFSHIAHMFVFFLDAMIDKMTATQGRTSSSCGGTGGQCVAARRNGEWPISIGSDRGSLAHRQ